MNIGKSFKLLLSNIIMQLKNVDSLLKGSTITSTLLGGSLAVVHPMDCKTEPVNFVYDQIKLSPDWVHQVEIVHEKK